MSREEPIYLKKLGKGDMRWSTKKTVMVWILDTEEKFFPSHKIGRTRSHTRLGPYIRGKPVYPITNGSDS